MDIARECAIAFAASAVSSLPAVADGRSRTSPDRGHVASIWRGYCAGERAGSGERQLQWTTAPADRARWRRWRPSVSGLAGCRPARGSNAGCRLAKPGVLYTVSTQKSTGNEHMTSWLDTLRALKAPGIAVALCVWLLLGRAAAQTGPDNNQLKEVQIAAGAFSLADPIPAWVE